MLGHGLTLLAGTSQHHFIIDKICTISMPQQMVGAVDIFGVDRRHDEIGRPTAQAFVIFGFIPRWLRRASKIGRQAERVGQITDNRRVLASSGHGRFQAGCGAAGKRALHRAHTALHPGCGRAKCRNAMLLQHHHAKVEGDGIKASGKHNPRARRLGGRVMLVDFLTHPCRFTA